MITESPSSDYLNSYHTNCFYYTFWAVLSLLYKLCKANTGLWFFYFASFHALNTMLIYWFFKYIRTTIKMESSNETNLWGALFFLFSPFMSENILWTATHHYTLCASLFLCMSILFMKIIIGQESKGYYVLFYLLFLLSITTLEITFFFPFIFGLIYLVTKKRNSETLSIIHFLKRILLPLISICILYLILLHQLRGVWLPHYYKGEVHFLFHDLSTYLLRSLVKFFTLASYWDFSFREPVFVFIAKYWILCLGALFILIGVLLSSFYFKERKNLALVSLLLGLSFLFILPVLHTNFSVLFTYEADRYLYFFSIMAFQFVAVVFSCWRAGGRFLSLLYCLLLIIFVCRSSEDKRKAGLYFSKYTHSFKDTCQGRTFILNMPYVCHDQRMYYFLDGFTQSYKIFYKKDLSKRVFNIMSHTVTTLKDSFEVKWLSDSVAFFRLKTPDEIYLANCNYPPSLIENDQYRFEMRENNAYTLLIKNRKKEDIVLYFENLQFKKLDALND